MYEARVKAALPDIRERLAEAAAKSGREPGAVKLVAVTKAHPPEAVTAAVAAGLTDVGENRVAELEWKREQLPDVPVRWHMVGHVQSRKADRVASLADLVHSVDTPKLARRLSAAAAALGHPVHVLVQVNVSGEGSKSGLEGDRVLATLDEIASLPGLSVDGLMTMAPLDAPEAVLRHTFAGLRDTLERARSRDVRLGAELSMGMTNDFEIAVEEGSTIVRLGTALFGKRPT